MPRLSCPSDQAGAPCRVRRRILRGTAAIASLGVTGLLQLLAVESAYADWSAAAFESESLEGALKALSAGAPIDHESISIHAPARAENGAVVPVQVKTGLQEVSEISLLAVSNPKPLVALVRPGVKAVPQISTRIRLHKHSILLALVTTSDGVFAANHSVEVGQGGCDA